MSIKSVWASLVPGDIVEVVAPGMPWTRDLIPKAKAYIESLGLEARIPKDIFGKDLLCANSYEKRIGHFKKALLAKDSKAIWCLRGGYGSMHLLKELKKIKRKPNKLFIGLSDITILHHYFLDHHGWATLHGPNLKRLALGEASRKEESFLKKAIFGQSTRLSFSLSPLNREARKKKKWSGSMTGGNLATCLSTVGTPYAMKPKSRFLFLEDIGERGYKVDRMLHQLELSGSLKGVKGILFGDFVGGDEPGHSSSKVSKVLKAFAEDKKYPVFKGVPSGHGRVQMPIPFGTEGSITGGPRGRFEFDLGSRA